MTAVCLDCGAVYYADFGHAGPLLAWAEVADDEADLQLRIRALMHQSFTAGRDSCDPVTDNPDEFVRRVKILYAFSTAGGPR